MSLEEHHWRNIFKYTVNDEKRYNAMTLPELHSILVSKRASLKDKSHHTKPAEIRKALRLDDLKSRYRNYVLAHHPNKQVNPSAVPPSKFPFDIIKPKYKEGQAYLTGKRVQYNNLYNSNGGSTNSKRSTNSTNSNSNTNSNSSEQRNVKLALANEKLQKKARNLKNNQLNMIADYVDFHDAIPAEFWNMHDAYFSPRKAGKPWLKRIPGETEKKYAERATNIAKQIIDHDVLSKSLDTSMSKHIPIWASLSDAEKTAFLKMASKHAANQKRGFDRQRKEVRTMLPAVSNKKKNNDKIDFLMRAEGLNANAAAKVVELSKRTNIRTNRNLRRARIEMGLPNINRNNNNENGILMLTSSPHRRSPSPPISQAPKKKRKIVPERVNPISANNPFLGL